MNAQLKQITELAITRPEFDNKRVADYALWFVHNETKLREYYVALGRHMPEVSNDHLLQFSRAQNFLDFSRCQWDQERGAFR